MSTGPARNIWPVGKVRLAWPEGIGWTRRVTPAGMPRARTVTPPLVTRWSVVGAVVGAGAVVGPSVGAVEGVGAGMGAGVGGGVGPGVSRGAPTSTRTLISSAVEAALEVSVTTRANLRTALSASPSGAVKTGEIVSAPLKATLGPPDCVQAQASGRPSGSMLREPSRVTVSPSPTVWSGPALAVGGSLTSTTIRVKVAEADKEPSVAVTRMVSVAGVSASRGSPLKMRASVLAMKVSHAGREPPPSRADVWVSASSSGYWKASAW